MIFLDTAITSQMMRLESWSFGGYRASFIAIIPSSTQIQTRRA